MRNEKKYTFGLRLKLVIFTTTLAIITYSTSAFFIYLLSGYAENIISPTVFTLITFLLGIVWSGVLAYFGSGIIMRALKRLERAAYQAAEGHINEDVPLPKSDDEIRGLSLAFNEMLHNMRSMVQRIEANFHVTNGQVTQIT
jgi:methyl-accepting chemotaxis protein